MHLSKHFHLAFQGGGAKGIAYVGAYKSIRHQECYDLYSDNSEKIPIPIKSIIGSSAGGIIALVISTGIPEYELQKICYKLNTIPLDDRIYQSDRSVVARDDYGNEMTSERVLKNLVRMFEQYGIIKEESLTKLWKDFQETEVSS